MKFDEPRTAALDALRLPAAPLAQGARTEGERHIAEHLLSALPFRLTGAQDRAMKEILSDLGEPHPMQRLLQGDVGSGKTIVAGIACLAAVDRAPRPR